MSHLSFVYKKPLISSTPPTSKLAMLEQFTLSLGGAGNFAVAMVCFKQKLCLKKQKRNTIKISNSKSRALKI